MRAPAVGQSAVPFGVDRLVQLPVALQGHVGGGVNLVTGSAVGANAGVPPAAGPGIGVAAPSTLRRSPRTSRPARP